MFFIKLHETINPNLLPIKGKPCDAKLTASVQYVEKTTYSTRLSW